MGVPTELVDMFCSAKLDIFACGNEFVAKLLPLAAVKLLRSEILCKRTELNYIRP